jgi:uncharacterized protein
MKIYVISEIYGDLTRVEYFAAKLQKEKPDLLIIAGDLTAIGLFDQRGFCQRVLDLLELSGVRVLAIPGNNDGGEVQEVLEAFGVNLHDSAQTIKDLGLIGFGGAKTPFKTPFEPEDQTVVASLEKNFVRLDDKKIKRKIIVVHNPPYNTKVDKIKGGKHVGSKPLRKFLEKSQPNLCISAHITESKGEDKIGKTKIFYPGPFFEGYYGIIEIPKKGVIKTKSVKM